METKICPRCKIEFPKTEEYFKTRIQKHYKSSETFIQILMCKPCYKLYNYNMYHNNKERVKKYRAKYMAKNRDKINETLKKYRILNADKVKKWSRDSTIRDKTPEKRKLRKIKERDNLSDNYIKSLITKGSSISRSDISPDLIEAWKLHIRIERINKQLLTND